MKCPHCLENGAFSFKENYIDTTYENEAWAINSCRCPNERCQKIVVFLVSNHVSINRSGLQFLGRLSSVMVYPKGSVRTPIPKEVPEPYSSDYKEACLVLSDSPKASAALSRRCLQHILREVEKVKQSDLSSEIQEIIERGKLPSETLQSLDAIRVIGNFAAHPIKSKQTGEVIDVEPGEAEWNLDVLESLFDYYFVQPAILKSKRDALNEKLKAAGKPPLK